MDLSAIFKSVSAQLTEQQATLNEADDFNHDHGDHMVQIFNLVQNAVSKKSDQPISEQLAFASQVVEKEAESGSAKVYAQGLSAAAKNFTNTDLHPDNLGMLVKSLLNVKDEQPPEKKTDNILGSLLSGLTGNQDTSEDEQKLGVDELLRAGLAFYQSKQEGGSITDALIGALMAASPLGATKHRAMSGSMIASTIMDFANSSTK